MKVVTLIPPNLQKDKQEHKSRTKKGKPEKLKRCIRTAAGSSWEDPSLLEWDAGEWARVRGLCCSAKGGELGSSTPHCRQPVSPPPGEPDCGSGGRPAPSHRTELGKGDWCVGPLAHFVHEVPGLLKEKYHSFFSLTFCEKF